MEAEKRNKAKQIIPATRILQSVVGTGKIKKEHIEKAQAVIDRVQGRLNLSDFAQDHLKEISQALNDIQNKNGSDEDIIRACTHSIVNFKSAAGVFGDGEYLTLCSLIFQFFESAKEVDEDFFDLTGAYFSIMTSILVDNAFSDKEIQMLTVEMNKTCERYYAKHPDVKPSKIIDNVDLTFGDIKEFKDIEDRDE